MAIDNPAGQQASDDVMRFLMSSDLPVGQVISRSLLECGPDEPLHEVARRMSEARCSSIIVVDSERVMGIWTERDALAMDFSKDGQFDVPMAQVMNSPVKTVPEGMTLREITGRFREDGVRHYLVVDDDGQRVGIVSQTDVVLNQGVEHYLRLRTVGSVLKGPAPMIDADASLWDTSRQMARRRSDAVVVAYEGGDYGIITERDLVRYIGEQRCGATVGDLASRPLLTTSEEASLYRVRGMLIESGLRHIGVVTARGALVGLISFTDILYGIEVVYVEELQHALKERDRALKVSQRSLHLAERVIESSPQGIMITGPDGRILSVNPAFTRLTGYNEQEALGQSPALLSSGRHDREFYTTMWQALGRDGHWQGEIWNRRKNGELFPELLTITAICDDQGEVSHYAALFSDISALKESEQRIKHLAYYDPLTGLPNRRLFGDRLNMAIAHAHRSSTRVAVMFVDLDRFKRINDSLGHSVGDHLLTQVAERLGNCVREDDTVARMGGDEFIILVSDVTHVEDAAVLARRVGDSLSRPFVLDGEELIITCSIGISFYPDDNLVAEELIKNADAAMYRAKDTGRNSYQLYTPTMNARSLEHLAMETGLRKALERDEFVVFYQPMVDAQSGSVVEAEALVRWLHPEMGLIAPADFIPLAEETGLIVPIGERVLRRVCRQLRQWREQGLVGMRVAVNISACQFDDEGFVEKIRTILAEEQADPQSLILELTETALMDDALESVRMLDALRAMGLGLAVDDFGTGYSSLNYLKRFPITILKIDRSFIRDIDRSSEDAAIVSAVIALAHSLGLSVVAEGVEEAAQLACLQDSGCDVIQGFYFGLPQPEDVFIRENRARMTWNRD